ncbi:hypothetical protein HID58_022177, partial [Brassica napus]
DTNKDADFKLSQACLDLVLSVLLATSASICTKVNTFCGTVAAEVAMDGWLDGWIFFQKEEVAMDGFIGNITTSTSVSPTSSAPLVFAAAGTLSLSIPVVDLKCKSSSMSPSVETSTQFVYNSSLPSTPSSFPDLFVDNVVATSSDSLDLSQRSRGNR